MIDGGLLKTVAPVPTATPTLRCTGEADPGSRKGMQTRSPQNTIPGRGGSVVRATRRHSTWGDRYCHGSLRVVDRAQRQTAYRPEAPDEMLVVVFHENAVLSDPGLFEITVSHYPFDGHWVDTVGTTKMK